MNNLKDTYTLSNGVNIPCVGFGTWGLQMEKLLQIQFWKL